MFRNDLQKSKVCFILTAWVRGNPWTWDGQVYRPTFEDIAHSTGEAAMIRFTHALWSEDTLPIWLGFDRKHLRNIAELLLAMNNGESAIDGWISCRSPKDSLGHSVVWEDMVRKISRQP